MINKLLLQNVQIDDGEKSRIREDKRRVAKRMQCRWHVTGIGPDCEQVTACSMLCCTPCARHYSIYGSLLHRSKGYGSVVPLPLGRMLDSQSNVVADRAGLTDPHSHPSSANHTFPISAPPHSHD